MAQWPDDETVEVPVWNGATGMAPMTIVSRYTILPGMHQDDIFRALALRTNLLREQLDRIEALLSKPQHSTDHE